MTNTQDPVTRVVVVGAGFAGIGCAKALSKRHDVHVTLIDRHNYHQFQPLLYQVATCQLASGDIAMDIRTEFHKHVNVDVKLGTVTEVDIDAKQVRLDSGERYGGDVLVLAGGSRPNFFSTPGSEHTFPLYSLEDAQRLRSRVLAVFEEADRDPSLVDRGALTFVIVGGGPTGVETAGALAELIRDAMPSEYRDLGVDRSSIILVDHGPVVLKPFSSKAHAYAASALEKDGVVLRLETGVEEVRPDGVTLSDGSTIPSRCVIWGGGLKAEALADHAGVGTGAGGRIDVGGDLSVPGHPEVFVAGDLANVDAAAGGPFPQLGSVALQAGAWVARNIAHDLDGEPREPFEYHDKGIMAMIGRGAAVAEVGEHRHELHGPIAFSAWLGVHAALMSGVRQRIDAFVSWAWDYSTKTRGPQVLDRTDAARIDWGEDAIDPTDEMLHRDDD